MPSVWAISDSTAVKPVAVAPAVVGERNKMLGLQISATCGGANDVFAPVVVRDGASGVGAILWAGVVHILKTGTELDEQILVEFASPLVGSVNTAMTIEWNTADVGGGNFCTVNAQGISE